LWHDVAADIVIWETNCYSYFVTEPIIIWRNFGYNYYSEEQKNRGKKLIFWHQENFGDRKRKKKTGREEKK
jgi:hypothetical protein